ncbi:hypothetical protein ACFY0F_00515 [Streptomyces sp. NPDC001544]
MPSTGCGVQVAVQSPAGLQLLLEFVRRQPPQNREIQWCEC